jgi:hypothetical protein
MHGRSQVVPLAEPGPGSYLCIAQFLRGQPRLERFPAKCEAVRRRKRDQRNEGPVNTMLPLLFSLFRRKRTYVWSPAVDLRDPYVAAALVPVSYS